MFETPKDAGICPPAFDTHVYNTDWANKGNTCAPPGKTSNDDLMLYHLRGPESIWSPAV